MAVLHFFSCSMRWLQVVPCLLSRDTSSLDINNGHRVGQFVSQRRLVDTKLLWLSSPPRKISSLERRRDKAVAEQTIERKVKLCLASEAGPEGFKEARHWSVRVVQFLYPGRDTRHPRLESLVSLNQIVAHTACHRMPEFRWPKNVSHKHNPQWAFPPISREIKRNCPPPKKFRYIDQSWVVCYWGKKFSVLDFVFSLCVREWRHVDFPDKMRFCWEASSLRLKTRKVSE